MSVIRSVLKVLGGFLIAHGMKKAGAIVNLEDAVGLAFAIVGFVTSHVTHGDDSASTPPQPPTATKVAAILGTVLTVGMLLNGCASGDKRLELGGAYAPATTQSATNAAGDVTQQLVALQQPDFAFFQIDSAFDLAESAVSAAFKFERDNRAWLWSISHDIKHSLDQMRPEVVKVIQDYGIARKAYIASPTPAGLGILQQSLSKAQALSQAAGSVIVANAQRKQ